MVVCTILLASFAILSWSAAQTKSPTYDEPYHAIAAWLQLHYHDYRIDAADPPLWMYWAALATPKQSLTADFTSEPWTKIPSELNRQWWWCTRTLYGTPGNDADAFIRHQRAMMLVIGVALGMLIAWWSWKIAGATAAISATFFYSLDPNFLAHAALMKNDVAFSFAMAAMMFSLWRVGQKITWPRLFAVAVFAGVMLTVKFSGVLAVILIVVTLAIRSMQSASWPAFSRVLGNRKRRLMASTGIALAAAFFSILFIWAVYGFRSSPTPERYVYLNMDELSRMATANEWMTQHDGTIPSANEIAAATPSSTVRAIRFADRHRLLPQAWLAGLLFTYQSALIRPTFLNDQLSRTGWWYYFPFAMLVKTPIATLIAIVIGSLSAITAIFRKSLRSQQSQWTACCLLIPIAVYMTSAMRSNLNIGLRHVLPVYPFIFIAFGWMASRVWQPDRRWTKVAVAGLGMMLAIESWSAYPDYIPFFNLAAGGSSGGLHLLGDSNLDWGQDLKLLANWQQKHPGNRLYLSYFGLADPSNYGVKYIPLPGGYQYDRGSQFPTAPGTIAVSASNLQGVLVDPDLYEKFYKPLMNATPTEVLGGSIYLYDFPATTRR